MGRVPRISQRSLLATAALVAVAVYAVRCADTAAPRPARKPDAPLAIEATATHELADSLRAAEAAVAQAIPTVLRRLPPAGVGTKNCTTPQQVPWGKQIKSA